MDDDYLMEYQNAIIQRYKEKRERVQKRNKQIEKKNKRIGGVKR